MKKIIIQVKDISIEAELFDTPTAEAVDELLPLEGTVNVWGEEIYFQIPLKMDLEPDAREEVEEGELGYWPTGPAFCIFFGPTPVSTDEKPRAYSPVNIFGRTLQDARVLKTIGDGAVIRVSPAE
jgi:hypothetical protein